MSKISVYVSHKRSKQVSPRQWETIEIGMSQESDIDDLTVSPEAVREELRKQLDVEVLNQVTEYFNQFENGDEEDSPSQVTVTSTVKPSFPQAETSSKATVIVGGKKAEPTQLVREPIAEPTEGVVDDSKLAALRAKLQSEEGE